MDPEGKIQFGDYPISNRMRLRYLAACQAVTRIINSGSVPSADLGAISEAKGMYNRVLKQDRPDWLPVRRALGVSERAICHRAATRLSQLRVLIQNSQALAEHCARPIARGIARALWGAETKISAPSVLLAGYPGTGWGGHGAR